MAKGPKGDAPDDVAAIGLEITKALGTVVDGKRVGNAKYWVYAFFDYDGEPIYVGQTTEKLRVRIRRHLTNQRTDAVAMNVLDPFEVAEIEMWPFWGLAAGSSAETLNRAEYTVYQRVLAASTFQAVLNEKSIAKAETIELPPSVRCRIVPEALFERRKHADIRIARRASTIAALARVISERRIGPGLRQTLLTQARRLENLAARRLKEVRRIEPDDDADEE